MKAVWIGLLMLVGACAHQPSPELVAARGAYSDAQRGAGAQAPVMLKRAKDALTRAEKMDKQDPGSEEAKDQAYIAMRLSEAARARGQATVARQELAQVSRQRSQEMAKVPEPIVEEEKDELAALDKLPEGVVSKDARGTVIRSDDLQFKFDDSKLSSKAEQVLEVVAEAAQESKRPIVIEGFTDSVGSTDYNDKLSEKRAEAADEFLKSQGVDSKQLEAKGEGEAKPVADNSTSEGRAQNRRVEIVIEDEK